MQWLAVQGVSVPAFFYGTAWKEDRTEALTSLALRRGSRHRHRQPAQALPRGGRRRGASPPRSAAGRAATSCSCRRSSPTRGGQDHRLPYDPRAPLAAQVAQSFASSLEHLGVDVPRLVRAARPVARGTGWRRGRPRGLAGDGGAARGGHGRGCSASATSRSSSSRRLHRRRHGQARLRAEPLLRARTAGTRDVRAFCRDARHRLPGLLAADRQPARARPARRSADRRRAPGARRRRWCSASRCRSACSR